LIFAVALGGAAIVTTSSSGSRPHVHLHGSSSSSSSSSSSASKGGATSTAASQMRTASLAATPASAAALAAAADSSTSSAASSSSSVSSSSASASSSPGAFCISARHESYAALSPHTLAAYGVNSVLEPGVRNVLEVAPCGEENSASATATTTMTTKGGGIGDRYSVRWSTTPTSAHPGAAVKFAHFGGDTSPVATVTAAPLHAEFRLTATVTDGLTGAVHAVEHAAAVKAVRRELRRLTEEDREEYFRALHAVFTTDQEEGEAAYGPDFTSHTTLAALHSDLRYTYHGNLFFLTSHPVMQMQLDKSLKAVNPRVATPYWDFLEDAKLGAAWASADVYQENWFGPVATSGATDYRPTGRFFDVMRVMDADRTKFPHANHNAYGYVTWETALNPSAHLQRSGSVCNYPVTEGFSNCAHVSKCFAEFLDQDRDLLKFDLCLEHYVHANLHNQHGGMWACPAADWQAFHDANSDWLDAELYNALAVVMAQWSQEYYLEGLSSCASACDAAKDDLSTCRCVSSIPGVEEPEDVDALSAKEAASYTAGHWRSLCATNLHGRQVTTVQPDGSCHPAGVTAAQKAKLDKLVLKTVLWPGYYSDMATGAASIDPLFWVMHQMFDKATHALRLSPVYNAGKMEWNNGGGDSSQGLGWNATTPFTSAIFEPFIGDKVVANKEGYLTNKVIWSLLSPEKASSGYVYDQLTKWGSCDFDPMQQLPASASTRRRR
jgi:hypothetical protein